MITFDDYLDEMFADDDKKYELTEEEKNEIENIQQEELKKYGGFPKSTVEYEEYRKNLELRIENFIDECYNKKVKKQSKFDIYIQELEKKYPPLSEEERNSKEYQEEMERLLEDSRKIRYSMEKIRERRSNPENYTMEKIIEMAEQVDRDAKDFKGVYELTKDDEE